MNLMFQENGRDELGHLCALVDFAMAMKERLDEVNRHSFNNFQLRIGMCIHNLTLNNGLQSLLEKLFCFVICDMQE